MPIRTSSGFWLPLGLLCLTVLLAWLLYSPQLTGKPTNGLPLTLVRRGPDPDPRATDQDGLYHLIILTNRKARIRSEEIELNGLGTRLQTVFRTRSERLLLVSVKGQVTFGEVLSFFDAARSVDSLDIVLITPASAPLKEQPSLFIKDKHIYTQYFLNDKPYPVVMQPPSSR